MLINIVKKSRFSKDLNSNILLMRHGESLFNIEFNKLKDIKDEKLYEEKRNDIRFSERLLDSDLTELVFEQCKNSAEILKNTAIKYIFVSPVLRALNTCSMLLCQLELLNRDQTYNEEPKVIVHPFLYERLE